MYFSAIHATTTCQSNISYYNVYANCGVGVKCTQYPNAQAVETTCGPPAALPVAVSATTGSVTGNTNTNANTNTVTGRPSNATLGGVSGPSASGSGSASATATVSGSGSGSSSGPTSAPYPSTGYIIFHEVSGQFCALGNVIQSAIYPLNVCVQDVIGNVMYATSGNNIVAKSCNDDQCSMFPPLIS